MHLTRPARFDDRVALIPIRYAISRVRKTAAGSSAKLFVDRKDCSEDCSMEQIRGAYKNAGRCEKCQYLPLLPDSNAYYDMYMPIEE
jgi:hypothetical protein